VHYVDFIHHALESIEIPSMIKEFFTGLIIGFLVLAVVMLIKKALSKK